MARAVSDGVTRALPTELGPIVRTSLMLLAFTVMGGILGAAAAYVPPLALFMLGSLPLALLLAASFPTAAFVVALMLLFGLLPEFIMTALPLGGALLQPHEIILLILSMVIGLRSLPSVRVVLAPARPLWPLLSLLFVAVIAGIVVGKVLANNKMAMADARQFTAWLALPIALWIASRRKNALHWTIICLALVAALAMTIQLLTGIQILYSSRGAEALDTGEFSDVTRSAIGGGLYFLAYTAYMLFAHACESERHRLLALAGCMLVSVGIISSFNRAIWAGYALGILVFLATMPRLRFGRAGPLVILLLASTALTIAALVAAPRVGDAVIARAMSITKEGGRGTSLGFRFNENSAALATLRHSPIFGTGLGGEYKRSYRQGEIAGGFDIENTFIHNGYLWLWLKLGVIGLFFPLFLLFTVWRLYKRIIRSVDGESRFAGSQAAAVLSTTLMMMVSAITAPDWGSSSSIAALSVLLALLVTLRIGPREDDGSEIPIGNA